MKILLWGTGDFANKVCEHITYINKVCDEQIYEVEAFIDNDSSKWGGIFFDKRIIAPTQVAKQHSPIVIAVRVEEPIKDQIERKIGGEYYTYYDFVCRDLPIEKSYPDICLCAELEKKICLQRKLQNDKGDTKNNCELIAGVASIFSKNIFDAAAFLDTASMNIQPQKKGLTKNIAMYFYKYFNGGVERVISLLIREFSLKGYNVHLIVDELRRDSDYAIPAGVMVHQMTVKPSENYFKWLVEFANYLKVNNIGCLVSHHSYWQGNFYLYRLCKTIGTRFILEVHNHYTGFVGDELEYYKMLYKNTDCIVTLAEDDKLFWADKGIKCVCIPNPVVVRNVRRAKTEGRVNILWIGRIAIFQKNVLEIVKAASVVCNEKPDTIFSIVGSFENKQTEIKFKDIISRYGLENNFVFYGYERNVEKFYLEANLMILTSSFEGFGMTIAEAMSYGVPVVAYELPYLELFKSRKGCLFAPQLDYVKLGKQIIKILNDKYLQKKLSNEALEVAKQFSEVDTISLWESVIA